MASLRGGWLEEEIAPGSVHRQRLTRTLVAKRTRFQTARIAETASFGRCLVLDGELQSAEADEYIYHEALAHPALALHPAPKDVLILGGGEGAATREVLKHRTVRRCLMVDIDGEVVRFCKRYLASWHRGAFRDPRSQVVIGDARKFVEETDERFDVVLSDLPTPDRPGPADRLYSLDFYQTLARKLRPGGWLAVQSGSGHLLQLGLHRVLHSTLRRAFRTVRPYYAHVPSFDVPWSFLLCGQGGDPLRATAAVIDRALRDRLRGKLRFYDGVTHAGLFRVPKHLRELLRREKRLITDERPIRFDH